MHTNDRIPPPWRGPAALFALVLTATFQAGSGLQAQGVFQRGDCDESKVFDITDPILGLAYLFLGGREPPCLDACDIDDNGNLEITDAIRSLSYLFLGGPGPKPPFELEDVDPTADNLTCRNGRDPPTTLLVLPPEVFFHRLSNTQVLSVIAIDAAGASEDVHASSSTTYLAMTPAVADVTPEGLVTARGVGTATIRVRYRGVFGDCTVQVVPGADGKPVVRITSPAPQAVLTSPTVLVSGLVSAATSTLSLNGVSIGHQNGFFQAEVALVLGLNTFSVTATSAVGDGTAMVTVTRVTPGSAEAFGPDAKPLPVVPVPMASVPDTTPPVITITSPLAGALLLTGRIRVEGTVDDPGSLVTVNGVPGVIEGATFHAELRLPPGPATVVVRAVDSPGNAAQVSVAFTVDPVFPRLAITEPADVIAGVAPSTAVVVRGTVVPPGANVQVNGVTARVSGNTWEADLVFVPGANDVIATLALSGSLPRRAQSVRRIHVDVEGPHVEILHPPEAVLLSPAGYRSETALLRLAGRVGDFGLPRGLAGPITLTVGGVPATIVEDSFAADVVLGAGTQTLELRAQDARGKLTTRSLKVTRGGLLAPTLAVVAGDGLTLTAGQGAPTLLVAEARDAAGALQRNVEITFEVLLGDGRLDGGVRRRTLLSGADGRAATQFTPGGEVGFSIVQASGAVQANSPVAFVLRTNAAAGRVLTAHRSRVDTGDAGDELRRPVQARLLDNLGNPIAGEAVVFRITAGDARLPGGTEEIVTTNSVGLASAVIRLPASGDSRSVLEATHAVASPVRFELAGLLPGAVADTEVTGSVVDDRGFALTGALVRVRTADVPLEATTDAFGGFRIAGVPAGDLLIVPVVAGLEALESHAFASVGRRTEVGALRVLAVNDADAVQARSELISETTGALMTLPGLPGLRLRIAAGTAWFPDGTRAGRITLAAVGLKALPAPTPDDLHADVPVAIFPEGLRFDPPASLSLPAVRDIAGRSVPLFVHSASSAGFVELSRGLAGEGDGAIAANAARGLRQGGLFFLSQAGPLSGRTGTVSGRVDVRMPGYLDVPQRAASHVLGFNVLAHSGELFLEATDLELPAPGRGAGFVFRRRYESRHNFQGALGWGWEHEYEDRRLYPSTSPGNIVRANGRGGFDEYLYDLAEDVFVSPIGVFARLFVDAQGFLVEREPDGTRYRYFALGEAAFAGRLESITDRLGNRLAFTRTATGRIAQARDALGRVVNYTHDVEGRITSIADTTGREVTFEYSAEGDLVVVTSPRILDTPTDNDFPLGRRREYVYSTGAIDQRLNHNLLRIIDPRETATTRLPRLTVVHGTDPALASFDRVVAQTLGGTNASGVAAGGTSSFVYEVARTLSDGAAIDDLEEYLLAQAGSTRFTDADGNELDVTWSGAGLPLSLRQHTRQGSRPRDPTRLHPLPGIVPPYYETRWSWTREGLLASRIEPRGDRHVFTYDETAPLRHLQATLIELAHHPVPDARGVSMPAVTTFRRDPLYGLVIAEVSPRGNDLTFEPPTGGDGGPDRYRTRRFLDYQEGASLAQLALDNGFNATDLEAALDAAHVELGLGDLNGDGDTGQRFGNEVQTRFPPTTPPDGGTSIEDTKTFRYNRFGQLIMEIDGAGRQRRLEYHPEIDWGGDEIPDPGDARDSTTGGLLARRFEDHGQPGAAREVMVESLTYDIRGYLASRRDANGNEEFLVHNALGELMERRLASPLKYRWHHIYDADGNRVRFRIENYTSTDTGSHFLVSDNRWIDAETEYDLLGQAVTETREVSAGEVGPARNIVTRHRYSPGGRRLLTIHPVPGTDEAWLHDERGLVIEHRRGVGSADEAVVRNFLDESGQVVIREGDLPQGAEERRHDGFGRLVASIDAAGGARVLERDIEGQVIVSSFLGASAGPTPVTTGGNGNVLLERSCFAHDERGREIERRQYRFDPGAGPGALAVALVTRSFFDLGGILRRRLDPGGVQISWEYDQAGRMASSIDTLGRAVAYRRDGNGNTVGETREWLTLLPVDPTIVNDPEYGPGGRYREKQSILRVFDGLNRITLLVDSGGGVWRARHDSRNNVILTSDATGTSMREDEPEFASLVSFLTDRQRASLNDHGNRRRYVYDNLNRLVEARHELRTNGSGAAQIDVTSPYNRDGIVTEKLEWNDNCLLIAWEDDDGRRTTVERNATGAVTRKLWPDGSVEVYRRDRAGRATTITDANGSVLTQEFDGLGRLSQRSIARGARVLGTTLQRFERDGLGRMTLAQDDNGPEEAADDALVLRRLDSLGNIVEEIQDGFSFTASRNVESRVIAFRYPDGSIFNLSRDALQHPTRLSGATGVLAELRHFGTGRLLEKRQPAGTVLSFLRNDPGGVPRNSAYDVFGEPVEQIYRDAMNVAFHGFEYGRDRNGFKLFEKPLHRADNLGEVWRYDSIYRIQTFLPNVFEPRVPPQDPIEKVVFYPDGNHSWRLLEVNFSVRKLEVSQRNAYTKSDDDPLTYDARGSLSTLGQFAYFHDALGRLVRVDKQGRIAALYKYDAVGAEVAEDFAARGRRVSKDVRIPAREQPAGYLRFTWWGERLAEERDAQSQPLRQYVYADDRSPQAMFVRGSGEAKLYSILHDAAGSPTAFLDAAGVIDETLRYDVHGAPRFFNSFGSPLNFSGLANAIAFGAHYYDFETGFLARGARFFDPVFGRFTTDASPLLPGAFLDWNGYLAPGLEGLPGEVSGRSSRVRQEDYLQPFQIAGLAAREAQHAK